MYLQIDKS